MTDHHPDALFDLAPVVPPAQAKPSPDRRRRQIQAGKLAVGEHPLSAALGCRIVLHAEAAPADDREAFGRRCGNCWYRVLVRPHHRTYPKCAFGRTNPTDRDSGWPRRTSGAGTDVAAWWPACVDHTWGDPGIGPDAARFVPPAAPVAGVVGGGGGR